MILAHLKKSVSEHDGKEMLSASTRYAIKASTVVVLRKCSKHPDCYCLFEMGEKNSKGEVAI